MTKEITSNQDVINSRDVIARILELESERDELRDAITEADEAEAEDLGDAHDALAEWDADYGAELTALKALAEEGERFPGWERGIVLIRDDYFEDFAKQEAEDLGLIEDSNRWPATWIDWKAAATQLQADYSTVAFDGVDYWVRS